MHLTYPKDRDASAKIVGLAKALRLAIGDPPYWEAGLFDGPAPGAMLSG